jgi:hypothetical protein
MRIYAASGSLHPSASFPPGSPLSTSIGIYMPPIPTPPNNKLLNCLQYAPYTLGLALHLLLFHSHHARYSRIATPHLLVMWPGGCSTSRALLIHGNILYTLVVSDVQAHQSNISTCTRVFTTNHKLLATLTQCTSIISRNLKFK